MGQSKPISAVIITFNEEANIRRCITSLMDVVDEVVVVDSHSTDNTVMICKELNTRVILQPFLGYIEQKNFALSCAQHDYVLSLDADEALSEDLAQTIRALKSDLSHSAYRFNRLNNYYGKWLRHGKWYPDRKVRLWDKTKYQWAGTNPHDKVALPKNADVKLIRKDILHYAYPTVSAHVRQNQNFAMISARAAADKGRKSNLIIHVFLDPLFMFVKRYFIFLGFLDGYYGFVACMNSAILNFTKYVYLREINRQKKV